MKREEGFIDVPGGNVWYEIVGNKEATPLIALHGGPGYPHDSLESLEYLADERKVIFYDQLGCGNSKRTTDKSLWTVDHFVRELQKIVKELKLKKYHILGHSWGAGLAVSFAFSKPSGLQSLILTDPYISTPHWEKDANRLLSTMPPAMQRALKEGKTTSKQFQEARKEFYFRHVYRFKKFPVACIRADHKMNGEMYRYMWGPEEFDPRGTLKTFDLTPRLSEIKIPVLLLCGRFDEATPESLQYFHPLLPNATMKVFEKSAHMPHWTEKEVYMTTVRRFLRNIF
ncbi:MAG TPA: proline iminopeptidase-family hydrolase [Candidatus Sulfotelmatobacter sp.]|jgi:proline iminopeptidase|nr:proline iminopeptidase-family hydrolase [Candidatus Sulfotelmatobacter sp.]